MEPAVGISTDPNETLLRVCEGLPEDAKALVLDMQRFQEKRLWYQLTLTAQRFLARSDTKSVHIELYEVFVSKFLDNIDQLRLVQIAVVVAAAYRDPKTAQEFLEKVCARVETGGFQEATILATVECAHYKLVQGDLDAVQAVIQNCQTKLDALDSPDPSVVASFYRISADYHKAKADYAEYYANSLLYLACIDVSTELSKDERLSRAHDLAVSALLGTTIYNFGELLMHPILTVLEKSDLAWLRDLLFAFNSGNIGKFEALSPRFQSENAFAEHHAFLRQKICLMALIESVFKRPPGARVISFDTIAVETKLPPHEVEHLVMKALSLKLIIGTLDQVLRCANISWVQPRVLDKDQLKGLQMRIGGWSARVSATESFAALERGRAGLGMTIVAN